MPLKGWLTIFLMLISLSAARGKPALEKPDLKFGFIKLTDVAPLVIAQQKGFFMEEGLFVTLEAQANWKVLLDGIVDGNLDGAHMLFGQPLGAALGIGTQTPLISAFVMDVNGNAITMAKDVWATMKKEVPLRDGIPVHPISAATLKPVLVDFKKAGKPFKMAMVFPVSTHNYQLRFWLAEGGLSPGFYTSGDPNGTTNADVFLSVTPPPQMPTTLEAGTIFGFCVGEPWNQQAVFKDIGVPVIATTEFLNFIPDKIFGVRADFNDKYPNTHIAVIKALLRASQWLDAEGGVNRKEAVAILADHRFVGADAQIIANSMTGTFEFERGDRRSLPDFNIFFRNYASYPYYSDAIWYLSQMRRWGQIPEQKPDSWYANIAQSAFRPDIFLKAAEALVAEGKMKREEVFPKSDGYKPASTEFLGGKSFDGHKPNDYLRQFEIGNQGKRQSGLSH